MPWRGPEYDGEFPTLGWAQLSLICEYLRVPSGPNTGAAFKLTDEQARFLLRWYAIDENGRWLYRRGVLRRLKGWGKSPFAASWLFAEFCGDVVFDGWDAQGEPVGRPWPTPWLQVAAVSEDQTDNTFVALYEMLADSPAIDDFHLDLGQTRVFKTGRPGSRIEPVTAAFGSREGQPITGAVLDQSETWHRTNGGVKLAAVLRRNAAKMGGRTLETPNAHSPGEGSVAEESYKASEKGAAGVLYDSLEPPPIDDLQDTAKLRDAILIARGDSTWVDIDRYAADIQDPATDPADARRWFLNQIVKGSGRAIDPTRWDQLARPDGWPEKGTYIGLGFDGSTSNDATALIGCTQEGYLFTIKVWERPQGARDWRVPRGEVADSVVDAMDRWRVGRMFCDPPQWQSEIEFWEQEFRAPGKSGDEATIVLALETNSGRRFAPACDRFTTAIAEGWLTHDGSEVLRRHVSNMARVPVRATATLEDGRTRYVFVKSDTGKIDAGIAAVLALEAAATMPAESELVSEVWFV